MITDEDLKPKEQLIRKKWLLILCLLPIVGALFLVDGGGLVEQASARLGFMSETLVATMIDDVEYNYYYDDIFETERYQQIRDDLTQKPVKTFGDFNTYINELSRLAGDEFSYFYYDSLLDARSDYSEVNSSDYEDDFSSYMQDGIPVIRFSQFAYGTGDRVVDALKEIHQSGKPMVLLDLTDNPGGMIDQCVEICDALLPDTVILEEQYNDLSRYQYISDTQMMAFSKIIILVNGDSASCSEIMALTLKEHLKDKVVLIGSETYGKKVTQSVNQDDCLHFSLFLVTGKWSVEGKTTEDLNGYLVPWRHKNLKGFDDSFKEARTLMQQEGLIQ